MNAHGETLRLTLRRKEKKGRWNTTVYTAHLESRVGLTLLLRPPPSHGVLTLSLLPSPTSNPLRSTTTSTPLLLTCEQALSLSPRTPAPWPQALRPTPYTLPEVVFEDTTQHDHPASTTATVCRHIWSSLHWGRPYSTASFPERHRLARLKRCLSQTSAVCLPVYSWMNNSLAQSPCLVAAYLEGNCGTGCAFLIQSDFSAP